MNRTATSTRLVLPAILLTMILSACGDPAGPDTHDGANPIAELPRALTAPEQAVIAEANSFGFSLVARVADVDGRPNIVLSPLSASLALGMTLNGAAGTTFDAMRSALGFDGLSQQEINDAYRGLLDLLTTLDPDVHIDIADAVWANQEVAFHDAFLMAVRDAFSARIESADFSDPVTVASINNWVSDNTDGHIDHIVDRLDPSLVMLLLNTIYLDGSWTTKFDASKTHAADFTREDGSKVSVDMMNLSDAELRLAGTEAYQAVELPYGGGAFSMIVLVPSGDVTARTLLRDLDAVAWQELDGRLKTRKVDQFSLPKFTLRYDRYLNDVLEAMGMGVAFRPGADFTPMSPAGDRMCLDFVHQKAFIQVDERGTRAAAATSVGVSVTSFSSFVADRPFVFAIREHLSGTILFMGMVGDPTYEDPGAEPPASTCR